MLSKICDYSHFLRKKFWNDFYIILKYCLITLMYPNAFLDSIVLIFVKHFEVCLWSVNFRVLEYPPLQLKIAGQWTVDKKLDTGQWTKNWTADSGQKIVDKKLKNGQCAKNRTLESSGQYTLNTRQYREWTLFSRKYTNFN